MIFRQWQQVLDGTKMQTRRLVKESDYTWRNPLVFPPEITEVCGANRVRWTKGKTYAVQPGRGKKTVGRIRITGIRREQLQDISPADCSAEGIRTILNEWGTPWYSNNSADIFGEWKSRRGAFRALWDSIYGKMKGAHWQDNPEVWVLEFEVAE